MAKFKKTTQLDINKDQQIPTYRYECHSLVPRIRFINYRWVGKKSVAVFEEYCKNHGVPDLIHSHSVFVGGVVGRYLSDRYNIPQIHTEHASEMIWGDGYQNGGDVKAIIDVAKSSNIFFVVSQFSKTEMLKRYPLNESNVQVLANVVNPIFSDSYKNKKIGQPFELLAVGHLIVRKGMGKIIEAVKKVNESGILCKLSVAGEGALRFELEALIERLELGEQISLVGQVGRERIKELLDSSHALVSASSLETFGVNITEALACGRPVVSTNSGGPQDIVSPENGYLTQATDADSIADGIMNLYKHYDEYDPEAIRKDCIERFSEETIFNKLVGAYKSVLK